MYFNFLKEEIESSYMPHNYMNFSTTGDGRLDSAESESVVIHHLKELFQGTEVEVHEAPDKRWWYDVLIKYKNEIYPINIKITSGVSYDNISSKQGLFYALTGIWPEGQSGLTRWESYNTLLTKNFNPVSNTDYYFIIYFKEEETFLFTSLKRLNTLMANGNNLPFQCKWPDNCEITSRSQEEQSFYLMEIYYSSWVKKTGGFEPLLKWKEGQKNELY